MYNICCYGEYFFTNVLFFFIIVGKFMWYKKNTTHYDIIIILNLSIHGCNKSQHPISDYFSIAACHIMLFIITVMIIHIWYHFSVEISFLINFLPNLLRKVFFLIIIIHLIDVNIILYTQVQFANITNVHIYKTAWITKIKKRENAGYFSSSVSIMLYV